jgi:hypothetical protein
MKIKVTCTCFNPITLLFILFIPNYLLFRCVFPSFLAHFRPPGSGSAFGIRIRIQTAFECRSNADLDSGSETLELKVYLS